jgi:brefeldin A-inhibited guanine nucleotide-exchange protein
MEKFAERYTAQNPDVFPTADVAFILAFSIIMLNTDLHNPAIKEERRMTKDGFIRNNRGICDGQDLPQELLKDIFDRIKDNPISLKEDDEARDRRAGESKTSTPAIVSLPAALSPSAFFTSHYDELDRTKQTSFNKERDQIVRTTESLLKRRRHSTTDHGKTNRKNRSNGHASRPPKGRYVRTKDSGLRDEYVSPMFEVAWGPALAAFSTAMISANGSIGALLSIATDEELELAAANAAETIEVCLTGFRFAVCTAGLCGNDVARDAFMLALTRFSQLGTGILLEPRHVRCIQTMLALARQDGELLGCSWEHVFKSLSEINRFHQLFQLMARNDRVMAHAAERRKSKLQDRERRLREREELKAAKEASDSLDDVSISASSIGGVSEASYGDSYYQDSDLFSDSESFDFEEVMDKKEIDEANARTVYEAVFEGAIEAIYERSSSLSTVAVKEFVLQLCRVSRMEISHYGGQVGSDANQVDLTQVHYRQHHTLLLNSPSKEGEGFHHHQTNIYNLQKIVEVTHYNMESRPRLVFAELWQTVAAHLTSTALHSNPAVAMYAVDSFRQLSIQYLQREELGVFEFQRRFLKPLETVMSRSEVATTKELLLKCVERLILMFGSSDGEGNKGGMLRSGWRPVLTVLGLAGQDADEDIAKLGFSMLTAHLQQCLTLEKGENGEDKPRPGVLLAERFVDLVDALLTYVGGPHEDMSLKSIDNLLTLSAFLADESFALPLVKKRQANDEGGTDGKESGNNQELELWWPILLGISRTVGDPRKKVKSKSLEALMKIITTHFFPSTDKSKPTDDEKKSRQLQILQLVFRGVLTPVLEFSEVDVQDARPPPVPDDFERFLTAPKAVETKTNPKSKSYWLDTTFDQFMDGCIRICLLSIDAFSEDTLVEEIFAMLNSCLLSDSGALAVRGLRRLEQFITSDLKPNLITDDTWATVSHMLRRCLSVRGLPRPLATSTLNGTSGAAKQKVGDTEEVVNPVLEEKEAIREFVMEDKMLADRRYIGGNAVLVIGSFLGAERFTKTLGLRWRLFLVSGLGKAIRDWEYATSILSKHGGMAKTRGHNP